MNTQFSSSVSVPDDVLLNELNGEAVLLNLSNESYYGLDEIGTVFWHKIVEMETLEEAFSSLLDEYDVAPEQLHQDMEALIQNLVLHGLIELNEQKMA